MSASSLPLPQGKERLAQTICQSRNQIGLLVVIAIFLRSSP